MIWFRLELECSLFWGSIWQEFIIGLGYYVDPFISWHVCILIPHMALMTYDDLANKITVHLVYSRLVYTEMEISSFWWNFCDLLHWKLSFWQLPVQPVIKNFVLTISPFQCIAAVHGGSQATSMSPSSNENGWAAQDTTGTAKPGFEITGPLRGESNNDQWIWWQCLCLDLSHSVLSLSQFLRDGYNKVQ